MANDLTTRSEAPTGLAKRMPPEAMRWRSALLATESRPGRGAAIIPAKASSAVIAECEARLVPQDASEAARMAAKLTASWPHADDKSADPEAYVMALVLVLSKAPRWAASQACANIIESSRFRPAAAEVKAEIDKVLSETRTVLGHARGHLREAERRRRTGEDKAPTRSPEEVDAFIKSLYAGRRIPADPGDLTGSRPVSREASMARAAE